MLWVGKVGIVSNQSTSLCNLTCKASRYLDTDLPSLNRCVGGGTLWFGFICRDIACYVVDFCPHWGIFKYLFELTNQYLPQEGNFSFRDSAVKMLSRYLLEVE